MGFIHVALGIVFNTEKEILMALRPINKIQGGLWEFPGGKVETGETVEQALKRELFEEVGILATKVEPFVKYHPDFARFSPVKKKTHLTNSDGDFYTPRSKTVLLDIWYVYGYEGEAYGKEGQQVAWVSQEALTDLPVLAASRQIVKMLKVH